MLHASFSFRFQIGFRQHRNLPKSVHRPFALRVAIASRLEAIRFNGGRAHRFADVQERKKPLSMAQHFHFEDLRWEETQGVSSKLGSESKPQERCVVFEVCFEGQRYHTKLNVS